MRYQTAPCPVPPTAGGDGTLIVAASPSAGRQSRDAPRLAPRVQRARMRGRFFAEAYVAAQRIDGRQLAAEVKSGVRRSIEAAVALGQHRPGLAVVKIGDDPA